MKSWLISEDEIREIIKNCDEIVNSNNPSADMFGEKTCVIRGMNLNNPLWAAIYASVVDLDNRNSRCFAENLSRWLRIILEHKKDWLSEKIYAKAIEVET